MLYHDRYSTSFLHVCCIAFDTVYPNDIHIIRYGFVSVLEMIRARVKLKNIASMPTSTSERENNELVMLFFPPSSQPFVSRLPRGCGLAPEGLWAGSFGVLSLPEWDIEFAETKRWACSPHLRMQLMRGQSMYPSGIIEDARTFFISSSLYIRQKRRIFARTLCAGCSPTTHKRKPTRIPHWNKTKLKQD